MPRRWPDASDDLPREKPSPVGLQRPLTQRDHGSRPPSLSTAPPVCTQGPGVISPGAKSVRGNADGQVLHRPSGAAGWIHTRCGAADPRICPIDRAKGPWRSSCTEAGRACRNELSRLLAPRAAAPACRKYHSPAADEQPSGQSFSNCRAARHEGKSDRTLT
jgi:hypothetical protein